MPHIRRRGHMIRLFDDGESLSRAAADLFVEQARKAIDRRGRFSVALSGGNTPTRTYALLAASPRREQVPWPRVHVFWGDERCVPPDDERSNARMARNALLNHVQVRPENVHPIRCEADPEAGADAYERLLRRHLSGSNGRLDLIFLGLGRDGHTASLFPGSPVLADDAHWAAGVQEGEGKVNRVTLTPTLINAARLVVFLVIGEKKAVILESVLNAAPEHDAPPAGRIRPRHGRLLWLVDRAAAARLPADPRRAAGATGILTS